MNIPDDALSRTGCPCKIINFSRNGVIGDSATHIFHKSIIANLDQMISISRKYHSQRTMSMSLCSAIPELCCDFSTGPEEKAISESLSENPYL